ncbi:MAG: PP0621 family protein [SAR324 cluster bacterium]
MGIFRLVLGLMRWLPYILVFVGVYLAFRRLLAPSRQGRRSAGEPPRPVSQLVQDAHCGVYVDAQAAVRRSVGKGQAFFCSEACADAWMSERRRA